MNGSLRYCDKCVVIKPDRAHHCSVCGTCVLKMDHHCPWVSGEVKISNFGTKTNRTHESFFYQKKKKKVNNCVNFTNYKYFVLFLGYGLLYCIYVAATVLRYFILFWEVCANGRLPISCSFFLVWIHWHFLVNDSIQSHVVRIGPINRRRSGPISYSVSVFRGGHVCHQLS